MAGCNYDDLAKGPTSNSSNNNNNNNNTNTTNSNTTTTTTTTNNNNNNNNNNNSSSSNSNNSNNTNNNSTSSSQICFRVSSGRDFTVSFEPSQTLCDILSRTIYDSKNFWITHNDKELLWYFPLSEQIRPTGNLTECRIHARSPKGRKYYDNSCSDVAGFESLCDSDSSTFSDSPNGCLDCQSEDFSACATYGCFDNSPFSARVNKRLIYDDPTDPLYQKRLYKREYQRKRYAGMSLTARQLRLEQMRSYERARRASETLAEREARLMRLRINQKRRLDHESEAERLRRLQRLQRNQRLRLEIETPEERQKRLIRLRDNARLRIERKKAIAQILGMTRRGRHKTTPAEMLMKQQANSMSDHEGGFSCMKLSQKNSSQRDGGYQYMESGNKNIANRQDGYSFMNQGGEKSVNDREDGFSYLNQNDKGVRQEDFYLDPSHKGVADRDGNYYMKPQGENKDNSERRSGFPCMGQIPSKDGADRARSGRTNFPCMSTSGDKGFETSENGTFSGLNQDQDKNDRELNFGCLTQDQNKDGGDRAVGFPCLGQDSGKNAPGERDGAFSYTLGLAERDGGFPYLKPNYKPTQVDCVRSETMTPRSEDLLNLDAIQGSMMGPDKRMSKGSGSSANANSNMSLLNIDSQQQKNINSSYPYSGIDSEKVVKKKRKKPMYSMADEPGEHSGLVTKTDMNDVKKCEMGLTKKGPESSRGPSLQGIIQQDCCEQVGKERMPGEPPNEYIPQSAISRESQRQKRLEQMRQYQRRRLETETTEERQNRLQRMRDNARNRSDKKRHMSQVQRTAPPVQKRLSTMDKDNMMRYQPLSDRDRESSWSCMEQNHKEKSEGFSYMSPGDKEQQEDDYPYLNTNNKSISDRDGDYSFMKSNISQGQVKDNPERGSVFPCMDHVQNKNSPERGGVFPCMEEANNKDIIERGRTGGPVFPCMTPAINKEAPDKGSGVFSCMDQDKNKRVLDRPGSVSNMNQNQTPTPTPNLNNQPQSKVSLDNRGATFPQYMIQSQGKDVIDRGIGSSNSNNNNNNSNNNNSGATISGGSGMVFPFLNTSQNRNIPDREMGGYPCSLTPEQNSRVGSFSYPNMCHSLGITERDGSYSYVKQTPDMRKKYAGESAHRKKGSEMLMGSAFASINKSDNSGGGGGGTGNAMAGYAKAEQNYMCASCERPLPKDQLSRFTPFPISIMAGSGADKICDDSKQWICKTCEKLKRNYHLFPNPVS